MRRARGANPYEYGGVRGCIFLACVPRARSQNSARPPLRVRSPEKPGDIRDHSPPDIAALTRVTGRVYRHALDLSLIERNILMILFRH